MTRAPYAHGFMPSHRHEARASHLRRLPACLLGAALLAAVGCVPPPQPSGFQPIGTTAAKAVAHAKHGPEHRKAVLAELTRCKEKPHPSCQPVLNEETKAILHEVLAQTAEMKAPPALAPNLHLPLDVFRELLEAGAVVMPATPSTRAGASPVEHAPPSMSYAYRSKDKIYRTLTLMQHESPGEDLVNQRFEKYKLLVEHGWPLDELDLLFAAYIAPDTAEGIALVEDVYRRLGNVPASESFHALGLARRPEKSYGEGKRYWTMGGWIDVAKSPFLIAAVLGKRTLATKILESGMERPPQAAAVAATGKSWAIELVAQRGVSSKGSCISADMLPAIEVVLQKGADPNKRCGNGPLPVTAALAACNTKAAALLMDRGARGDIAAVYWAIIAESKRCYLGTKEHPGDLLDRLLAPHSIDLDDASFRIEHQDSLVHVAARADLAGTVKVLLDAGARADRKNDLEQTPLDVAGPAAAAALTQRGAPKGDPAAIAAVQRRLWAEEDARRRREREEEREERREEAQRQAEERATQAREQRERDEREAQARRDMPNTGVDTDAFRRWALGGSQGTPRPSGSPSGVGRGASSPAPPPPPSTRASNAGSAGGREPPARTGSSSSPPPARALPTNICADWSNACQPYRNKRDECEARCQQDVGRSMTACVERRAAGDKGVKFIQATTECQRELEPTKKACGPRCASEHRCPNPQPPECRGSGGNGGTAL